MAIVRVSEVLSGIATFYKMSYANPLRVCNVCGSDILLKLYINSGFNLVGSIPTGIDVAIIASTTKEELIPSLFDSFVLPSGKKSLPDPADNKKITFMTGGFYAKVNFENMTIKDLLIAYEKDRAATASKPVNEEFLFYVEASRRYDLVLKLKRTVGAGSHPTDDAFSEDSSLSIGYEIQNI